MLLIFRGQHRTLARALMGALLLVAGLAIHGGAIFVGIGAVFIVWGGIAALSAQRAGCRVGNGGQVS